MASSTGLPSLTFSPSGFRGLGSRGGSANNFGFSGGSTKNSFGFQPFKYKPLKAPSGPTAQQALMAVYLHNKAHPHHSFLGKVLHAGEHTVEKGLDYISRPANAVSSALYEGSKNPQHFNIGAALHGAKLGIEGKERKGFGQFLSEHGVLQHHAFLRGAAGLGLDVAADPLTYLSLGTSADANIAARAAEKGLSKDALKGAIDAAQHGTFKTSAKALEGANLLKQAELHATAGLARVHALNLRSVERGLGETFSKKAMTSQLHGLQALSQSEIDTLAPKLVKVGYKLPFTKGVYATTKMKAPALIRVANKEGLIGHFPGLPKAAETIGKALKPGWRNEKMHALEIMSKHLAELRQDHMAHLVQQTLMPSVKDLGLSETEMQHALKWGETHPGIVKMRPGRADRTLNLTFLNKAVKAGEISDRQATFIKAWHDTTESLRKADAEYGVTYDSPLLKGAENNVLYVPHVRELETGAKPGYAGSVLAKKGFQYERKGGSQMSLIEKIQETHPNVKLASNPLEMIAKRAQAGAVKQSERFMENTVASTFGVPSRLPNIAEQLKLGRRYRDLSDQIDSMKTITGKGLADSQHEILRQTEEERLASLDKASEAHAAKELQIKRAISSTKGQITKAAKNKVPTARQFLGMKGEHFSQLVSKMGRHPLRKPLIEARAASKSLDSLERSVTKSVRDSHAITSVTGATPHGSKFKAAVADLIEKTKGALPKDTVDSLRQTYLLSPIKPRDSWAKRHDGLIEDLTTVIKHQRQQNAENLQKEIDRHFGGRLKQKNLAYSLQAKEKQLVKHQQSWSSIEAKVNARAQARLANRKVALDELQQKEFRRAAAISKVLDKIEKKVDYHNTSVKNPEAYKPGFKVSDRIKAPNGSPLSLPAEMDEALTRMRGALNNDEFLQKFHDTWQKLVAKWKVGVTVVNPGYRVRNTLSDLWNAYISPNGGVPLWAMGRYGSKAASLIQTIRHLPEDPSTWTKEQRDASKMFVEMYHHGVLAGLFQGDIDKVRRFLEGTGSAKDLAKSGHPLQALTKTATDFNRHAENWGRMMHYLYRREFQKLSAGESAKIVRAAHFDYEDLTPAEQNIKRWAVPFYTWTRKNIPYQISQMAQQPGKYAAFPLLQQEMNDASPKVPGEIVPSWIKQNLGFHVPFGGKGNFYLPVFGPVDLEKAQHPLSQGTSMLSPLLQIPAELALNKTFGTGAPIYGSENTHPRNPISGFAASLLSAIPGTNVGQTSRNVNGKKMTGPGASPIVSYLAQQTPLTNLLVNGESNIKKAQRGGGQKALLSELGGISTYRPDQQQQKSIATFEAQQGFKQYVRGLRDMGVLPESKKRKVSPAAAANNRASVYAFGGK